jgi:hypothetical protein
MQGKGVFNKSKLSFKVLVHYRARNLKTLQIPDGELEKKILKRMTYVQVVFQSSQPSVMVGRKNTTPSIENFKAQNRPLKECRGPLWFQCGPEFRFSFLF